MILSVSRRTDIPSRYAAWFMERVREGFAMCRSPYRPSYVTRIPITPDVVDAIVFWTKDPGPMLPYLDELDKRGFSYYFQVTLTGYGKDIEPGLRAKKEILEDCRKLSARTGKRSLVWRYDPIFFSDSYPLDWHKKCFSVFCREMAEVTDQVTISFLDMYKGMRASGLSEPDRAPLMDFAEFAAKEAEKNGLRICACCEKSELSRAGIQQAACIDPERIRDVIGAPLNWKRDRGQREGCGCCASVDIGVYDTCPNGCVYCYANHGPALLKRRFAQYRETSPLLCSELSPFDTVVEKKFESDRDRQMTLL